MQDQLKQANSLILIFLTLIHTTITGSTGTFFTSPLPLLAFRSCCICSNGLLMALERGSGWAILHLVAKSKRKQQNPTTKQPRSAVIFGFGFQLYGADLVFQLWHTALCMHQSQQPRNWEKNCMMNLDCSVCNGQTLQLLLNLEQVHVWRWISSWHFLHSLF